jgi:hypothetical protein
MLSAFLTAGKVVSVSYGKNAQFDLKAGETWFAEAK